MKPLRVAAGQTAIGYGPNSTTTTTLLPRAQPISEWLQTKEKHGTRPMVPGNRTSDLYVIIKSFTRRRNGPQRQNGGRELEPRATDSGGGHERPF